MGYIAGIVCTPARCAALARRIGVADDGRPLVDAWTTVVMDGGTISRAYALHLVDRIEVRENEIRVLGQRTEPTPVS